ncbi:site-specific integrase [Arthrobacter sp. 260]|nr:site-specific integrase [Arthrobacter sp. 260]
MSESKSAEVLSYNPVRNIKPLPKRKVKPKALNEPSLGEVRSAVRSWRNQPGTFVPPNDGTLADIVDVMLATGTRIGEVLALRWNDVDLVSSVPTVSITGTLIEPRHGPKYRQPVPKSEGSIRKIPLPQFAVSVLLRRRACSPPKNTVDAVFWSQNGTFMQPSSVRRSLRSALNAAGVEFDFKVTPHTFRKTVATLLAREAGKGAARSVIGHSKEETTDQYYIEPVTQVEDHRELIEGAFGQRPDRD